MGQGGPVIPVVRLHGVIAADQRPGRLNIEPGRPAAGKGFSIKQGSSGRHCRRSPGGSASAVAPHFQAHP